MTEMAIEELRGILAEVDPAVIIFGFGRAMEVFKGVGQAQAVCDRYGVGTMSGYQAVGHTRMATESAVTIAHSHPFCPAADLALVHNGSFSNYASIRRELEDEGVVLRHRQRLRGGCPVRWRGDVGRRSPWRRR